MNQRDFTKVIRDSDENDYARFEALADALAGMQKDIARISDDMKTLSTKVDERFDAVDKKMEPLVEAYNGIIFGKNLVTAVAGVVIAFTAIGGAVLAFIRFATK